jgi:hypothetical protein
MRREMFARGEPSPAREVGQALALVAAGESYRQAAWAACRAGRRTHERLSGRRGRLRDPNLDAAQGARQRLCGRRKPAPELRLCELHLRRSLENALAPLEGQPAHPVMRAVRHARFDHRNWAHFEAQARASHQHTSPLLPALTRWLDSYGELAGAQLQTRSSLGPNSIGTVEAALCQIDRAFHGRSQSFANRRRLNLLLDLMTLHGTGQADPRRWADRLRQRLHPRRGIAPQQRPHDDPRGHPSLLA